MTRQQTEASWYKSYLRYALFAGALFIVVAALHGTRSGPKQGSVAPDFELPRADIASGTFKLSSARGQPVVLEVFASWCHACKQLAPTLAQAARSERSSAIRFIGVNIDDSMETARRAAKQWELPFPVVHDDGQLARRYDISMLPTLILIDAEGVVRRVTSGVPSSQQLDGWLAELGKPS